MFTSAYDVVEAAGVLLFSGTTNDDDDYERYIKTFLSWDARAVDRDHPIAIVVVDPGNEAPNAKWRKKIAESTRTLRSNPLLIVVTSSPIVRGVVRAMQWIMPMPVEVASTATVAEAFALAERRRGRPITSLATLLEEARAATDRPATSKRAPRPGV